MTHEGIAVCIVSVGTVPTYLNVHCISGCITRVMGTQYPLIASYLERRNCGAGREVEMSVGALIVIYVINITGGWYTSTNSSKAISHTCAKGF